MTFSAAELLASMLGYLALLFAVGWLAERQKLPARLINHPAIYTLSLGVIAGGLAIYGASQLAGQYGYGFLLYYAGISLMLLLSPLLMLPVMRICRLYQLSSLADLLTFRFRSPWLGAIVTIAMLLALLPLLALQIQIIADGVELMGEGGGEPRGAALHNTLAIVFCLVTGLFAMYFGTRRLKPEERHTGLVTAIAFESLVKLTAMLALGAYALYGVFDGPAALQIWLQQHPAAVEMLNSPLRRDAAHALLLLFFAGTLTMPHLFHMAFSEGPDGARLGMASWGLGAYLLLLSLPILPITWAAMELGGRSGQFLPQVYSALALGLQGGSRSMSLVALLAGMSAASAVIIVSTLALANMCLKHLVLPLRLRGGTSLQAAPDIYAQLNWARGGLIAAIITAGFLFCQSVSDGELLVDLGLTAFTGTLQFLPCVLAALFWPRANRLGVSAGLLAGFATWFAVILAPLLRGVDAPQSLLGGGLIAAVDAPWAAASVGSLAINISLMIAVSLLTRPTAAEIASAEVCSLDDLVRPMRRTLALTTATDFRKALSAALGGQAADAEVDRALKDLKLTETENRPYALRQLRNRIEANLSGLLGPAIAFSIMQRCIPWQLDAAPSSEDISLIERGLESGHRRFTGLAADIDNLRRYHRETLRDLPIGVMSLGRDGEILMWNRSMEDVTAVRSEDIVGSYLSSLPNAWARLLGDFVGSGKTVEHKLHLQEPGSRGRWISLHRAAVESSSGMSEDEVIVVEDLTDYALLEQELLHNERLASVGRFAAGVAHEIGNPVTGIACLAQNLAVENDIGAVPEAAGTILKQTERITRIVESLVNFSHTGRDVTDPSQLTPVNLADCVDEAVHLLELDRSAKSIRFENRCDREQLVLADSQRLLQVFINLLGNARDASDAGASVEISAESAVNQLHVHVTDHGSGIPAAQQGQVFDPFFTTKEPGEGTGLGLSLVYSIVEGMGGRIRLQSPLQQGRGTRFTLTLNAAEYGVEYQ
ncbi:MAG: ATP-binding protein [Halieaceae bacterium]|jgi:signal transduction histidine kinase/Na+/proline symporter|nr:ATP-binding protein [Halieaceae bacterium]